MTEVEATNSGHKSGPSGFAAILLLVLTLSHNCFGI
jgi:hypothetical protein